MSDFWADAEVISVYTRAQAIADGVLIDVSDMAKERGFRFPVAVTQAVWAEYVTPSEFGRRNGQSEEGRLWDILHMLYLGCIGGAGISAMFPVFFQMGEGIRPKRVYLKGMVHGGDHGEPVITIMKLDED